MAKKITRSELNANFYGKIEDEISEIKKISELNNSKLTKIKKRLSLIDNEYFSQVIDEIDQTIGIQSLYLDASLTDEEKFFTIKNVLKGYLDEISSIIDQKIEVVDNFEDIFNLSNNEIASSVDGKLVELMTKLNNMSSIQEKNENIINHFEQLYPNIRKNLLIIDDKFENEKDGGIPYKERLEKAKGENKEMITKIKRNLNNYKIKWGWYIVGIVLLIVGILLSILIPIFAL